MWVAVPARGGPGHLAAAGAGGRDRGPRRRRPGAAGARGSRCGAGRGATGAVPSAGGGGVRGRGPRSFRGRGRRVRRLRDAGQLHHDGGGCGSAPGPGAAATRRRTPASSWPRQERSLHSPHLGLSGRFARRVGSRRRAAGNRRDHHLGDQLARQPARVPLGGPPGRPTGAPARPAPNSAMCTRTVVSGGARPARASGMSSKPAIATSSGTRTPASRNAHQASRWRRTVVWRRTPRPAARADAARRWPAS